MHTANIEIESDKTEIIYNSLQVESKNNTDRTKVDMHVKDNKLILSIEAKDITALRAALNSYIRWIDVALKMADIR
jgi:KEOPS complex subunit Pcc1